MTDWHTHTLEYNGEAVAELKWRRHNDTAEVHEKVYRFNKTIYRKLHEFHEGIKSVFREQGITSICTISDIHDKKMQKYWERAGFWFFSEVDNGIKTAAMEV